MAERSIHPFNQRRYTKPYKRVTEKGTWDWRARARNLLPQLGNHTKRPVWCHQPNVLGRKHLAATKKRSDCLPKAHRNQTPEDYHPITLLNSDYKILARITAQSLGPVLVEQLPETQFCGVPGNAILHAVATVGDTIAHAESRIIPLCVLSPDFKNDLIGSLTTTFFKHSMDTALVTPLSPASNGSMKVPHR